MREIAGRDEYCISLNHGSTYCYVILTTAPYAEPLGVGRLHERCASTRDASGRHGAAGANNSTLALTPALWLYGGRLRGYS